MPRAFDVSSDSPATVDQVHAAFRDPSYWQARLTEYGSGSIRLDSLVVEDASLYVATTQAMRNQALPGLVARAVRGDLTVVRTETWRLVDGVLRGDVAITTSGAPISGTADATVSPTAGGSVLRFAGTVQAKVPLIGGQIERFISSKIHDEIPGLQGFTTRWILANG